MNSFRKLTSEWGKITDFWDVMSCWEISINVLEKPTALSLQGRSEPS
jgi:hypothetical protein